MVDSDAYEQFINDDEGYLRWLGENPLGFVVNSERTPKAGYLVLHRATCKHINSPGRSNWTTTGYIKTCSGDVDTLANWGRNETGGALSLCGACRPSAPNRPESTTRQQGLEGEREQEVRRSGVSSKGVASPSGGSGTILKHKMLLSWGAGTVVTALVCPLIVEFIKSRSGLFNENRPAAGAEASGVLRKANQQSPTDLGDKSNPVREQASNASPRTPTVALPAKGADEDSLEDRLRSLPNLLVAEVKSKPFFDAKTSELVFEVTLGVDRTNYEVVRAGLVQALEKVARSRGTTLLRSKPAEFNGKPQERLLVNQDAPDLAGPGFGQTKDRLCIWVADFRDEARTAIRWNYYLLDLDLGNVCESISMPTERLGGEITRNPSQGRTKVSITARGEGGAVITEDEFEVLASEDLFRVSQYPGEDDESMPFLSNYLSFTGGERYLFVAPCSFLVKYFPGYKPTWELYYQAERVSRRRIKTSAEEAARIKEITCSVSYQHSSSTER